VPLSVPLTHTHTHSLFQHNTFFSLPPSPSPACLLLLNAHPSLLLPSSPPVHPPHHHPLHPCQRGGRGPEQTSRWRGLEDGQRREATLARMRPWQPTHNKLQDTGGRQSGRSRWVSFLLIFLLWLLSQVHPIPETTVHKIVCVALCAQDVSRPFNFEHLSCFSASTILFLSPSSLSAAFQSDRYLSACLCLFFLPFP
jgi:hypothetical protein